MVIDTALLSAAQLRSNIHDLFRSNDPDKDDCVWSTASPSDLGLRRTGGCGFDVRCRLLSAQPVL